MSDLKPILDLTAADYMNLDHRQRGEYACLTIAAGLNDAEDLSQRVLEFIHYEGVQFKAVKLKTISQRFARTAKRLGTDLSVVLGGLVRQGSIHHAVKNGGAVYYIDAVLAEAIAMGLGADLEQLKSALIKNAE